MKRKLGCVKYNYTLEKSETKKSKCNYYFTVAFQKINVSIIQYDLV